MIALAGCVPGDETSTESRSTAQPEGVAPPVAENAAPVWGTAAGWRVAPIPVATIGTPSAFVGESGNDIALERVQSARFLSDGRVVVADAGPREVMVFDTAGALVKRFGGRGEGPGELRSIGALHICGGDSIAVVDSRQTLHLFDSEGNFSRRARFRRGEQSVSLQGVSTSCGRALLQQRTRQPRLNRLGLTEDIFVWADAFSGSVDTVTTAGLLEGWTRRFQGVERPWVIPWGTSPRTHATRNDKLVLGNGRAPEFRRYGPTGSLELVFRWSPQPRPVTSRDRQRYAQQRSDFLSWAPPGVEETRFLFPALHEYPEVPAHKPLFDRLLLDDQGGTWVRTFPEESLGLFDSRLQQVPVFLEIWTVFDSAGTWLGDLTMPERFQLHAVDGNRLLGVSRDSLETQTVQVLRIEAVPVGQRD